METTSISHLETYLMEDQIWLHNLEFYKKTIQHFTELIEVVSQNLKKNPHPELSESYEFSEAFEKQLQHIQALEEEIRQHEALLVYESRFKELLGEREGKHWHPEIRKKMQQFEKSFSVLRETFFNYIEKAL